MIDKIFDQTETKMKKAIESFRNELNKIRTGKASASILDGIKVNYYGSVVPLNQAASISVPEVRLITIQPGIKACLTKSKKRFRNPISDSHRLATGISFGYRFLRLQKSEDWN